MGSNKGEGSVDGELVRSARRGPTGSIPLPQTVEEIGRLIEQSDVLQTILSIDKAEHGGFAHRCPAGWNSGYREEPMSKEEIRKARIVEKCLKPRSARTGSRIVSQR